MKQLAPVLLFAIFLLCCNSVKRVINDPKKTQKVVDSYIKGHPSENDTAYKIIPGDTITQIIIGYDTAFKVDTVMNTVEKTVTKTINNTRTIRDTVRITVTDNTAFAVAQKAVYVKDALLTAKDIQIKELKGDVSGWRWKFWLLVLIIALVVGLLLYVKLKPKIL